MYEFQQRQEGQEGKEPAEDGPRRRRRSQEISASGPTFVAQDIPPWDPLSGQASPFGKEVWDPLSGEAEPNSQSDETYDDSDPRTNLGQPETPETAANTGALQRKAQGPLLSQQALSEHLRHLFGEQDEVEQKAKDPHTVAQKGVAGSGGQMPHLDQIQRSFGSKHDLSQIGAHIGGKATDAAETLGAEAYATGNNVAFRGPPSLHTAAHEAAHVVQQQAGIQLKSGIGKDGDEHERNADAVADRVVRGESAQDLLPPAGKQAQVATAAGTIQRQGKTSSLAMPKVQASGVNLLIDGHIFAQSNLQSPESWALDSVHRWDESQRLLECKVTLFGSTTMRGTNHADRYLQDTYTRVVVHLWRDPQGESQNQPYLEQTISSKNFCPPNSAPSKAPPKVQRPPSEQQPKQSGLSAEQAEQKRRIDALPQELKDFLGLDHLFRASPVDYPHLLRLASLAAGLRPEAREQFRKIHLSEILFSPATAVNSLLEWMNARYAAADAEQAKEQSWINKVVGVVYHNRPPGLTKFAAGGDQKTEILAQRRLGDDDSEAAALARLKTSGKAGALTIEQGRYVSYAASTPFRYTSTRLESRPHIQPGVLALVSSEGIVVRPFEFDGGKPEFGQAPDMGTTYQHLNSVDDPFQGFRESFGANGDLSHLSEKELLKVFQAALKDTALVVLSRSEAEVRSRQSRFADRGAAVDESEFEHMKKAASELAEIDRRIDIYKREGQSANIGKWVNQPGAARREQNTERVLESLELERRRIVARYPLLSRLGHGGLSDWTAAKFKDQPKDKMVELLGSELPGILSSIAQARENVADGKVNLWGATNLVEATIAGLGLGEEQRKLILAHKRKKETEELISKVVLGIFAIGFGVGAISATRGLSVAFAAGALGLGAADAVEATLEHSVNNSAANVKEDREDGLARSSHWGWLVVAWASVALDASQLYQAAKAAVQAISTGAKIADQAETFADVAIAKGVSMGKDALVKHLRTLAGDVDPGTVFRYEHKAAIESRLRTGVEIDHNLAGDVRVHYKIDLFGTARLIGIKVGKSATVADVLAHEGIVKMIRRYEGLTGQIRKLWHQLLASVGAGPKVNPFPPGSKAFESWYELEKLPKIIRANAEKFSQGLSKADEAAIKAEIAHLERELAWHRQVVDQVVIEKGYGFIAKTGDSTREAINAHKYPLPPDITSIDDIGKSAYYYRKTPDGKDFELARKANVSDVGAKRPERDKDGKFTGRFIDVEPGTSKRLEYMGSTPSKDSSVGRKVIEAMKKESPPKIQDKGGKLEFLASDKKWYPIEEADMCHKVAAVTWWRNGGYKYGPKSDQARAFMRDEKNYYLDHYKINRREGANMRERYDDHP